TRTGGPLGGGSMHSPRDTQRRRQPTAASAAVFPDGLFLFTNGGRAVLAPGWHRVTVASLDFPLPDRYRAPDLSGLECEVQPGQDNEVNFVLMANGAVARQ